MNGTLRRYCSGGASLSQYPDGVPLTKVSPQPTAARQALADADRARIGADDDVGAAGAADRKEGDGPLRLVQELVGALLADLEGDGLSLLELTAAIGGAERRAAAEDDQKFLVGVVEVVGIRRLSRRDLPEAASD